MSRGNPERFPWGSNDPSVRKRTAVALGVALAATAVLYFGRLHDASARTDFHLLWFGAKTLASGRNPYALAGPGLEYDWPYRLIWPGTALAAVLPFTLLSAQSAALLFVFISTFLLAFGSTNDGWHRLPMFASAAFLDSVFAAQWTILLTASLFISWLAFFVAVKPQVGAAVLASAVSSRSWQAGLIGTALMFTVSFILLPTWPAEWLGLLRGVNHMKPPIAAPFGFLTVLLLLRWRRAEAWLLLVSALMPQTLMWYGALMPLAIAKTYREACLLSLASTVGFLLSAGVATARLPQAGTIIWGIFVCSVYLPATAALMMRPNAGELPAFLRVVQHSTRPVGVS